MNGKSRLFNSVLFLILISSQIFSQDKFTKIDELVNKYFEYGQFNGSALVSENGKILLDKGYGYANIEWKIPNTPDTKFRIGSITKQFTSMLIMQLVEKGKIDLNGKISDYLPYYRKETGSKITIQNLLTHTSGIPNLTNDPLIMQNLRDPVTVKDLVVNYCSKDLEFEPGSKFNYSNSGYIILGAIIEEVTGKKYDDVLSENILIPLNMNSSGYDHTADIIENRASGYDRTPSGLNNASYLDMSFPFSAGSLYSTVNDLFKWDQALYTDKLVSNESKEKIFTPFLKSYGFGWVIRDISVGDLEKRTVAHEGGINGFNTIITRFTDDNNCIILLNNTSKGSLVEMTEGIAGILYDQSNNVMPKRSLAEILYKSIAAKGISEALIEFNELKKNTNEYIIDENEINRLGYSFLQKGDLDEAIEVFKLNVEAFPNSSNAYDSLGEAYLKKGEKDLAILNYKKSVELNPNSESGKKALNELQTK